MLRKFLTVIISLAILGAGIGGIAIMGKLKKKPEEVEFVSVPPSLLYIVAEQKPASINVVVQGEVRPRTDITLTAQVGGRIVDVSSSFVDGGAFKKDEVLVRIEDADFRLALTRAKAQVAQAQQALGQEQAEADLARQDWYELGDGSRPSDLTLRLPQLAQAKANFDAAKADEQEARLNLNRTYVKAPFKGRVRRRIAGQGQFVAPGTQLGEIFATDVAEIRLPLTDANLATLGLPFGFIESASNPGPDVILRAQIGAKFNEWKGRIARTEGAIDSATRQIGAIAVVNDPYGAGASNGIPLAIGLFVEGTIIGEAIENAITLPLAALYGKDSIYIIDSEDRLRKKSVNVASSNGKEVIIVGGISPEDRVVISPLRGSEEGDLVAPIADDSTKTKQSFSDPDKDPLTADTKTQTTNEG